MSKPLLPFGWMPGHWGLKGTTRRIAEAEYYFTGYDLDIRLAEIEYSSHLQSQKLALAKLDIDLKYQKIGAEDHAKYG